jgi:glutamine synthetase
VYSFDHEDANGQFEFDFSYADVMTMADRFVLWRLMMKEIARKYGWEATFMPKPYADRTGSGAHFNMSLSDLTTGENISGDRNDPRGLGLSKVAYQFFGGVMKHAEAIVAVTCPTVNSYKRLIKTGSMTGYTWAPVFISYGGNNRTHMMRVPALRPQIEGDGSDQWRQSFRRAMGMPRGGHHGQSLSGRSDDVGRRSRRNRERHRSGRPYRSQHVRT